MALWLKEEGKDSDVVVSTRVRLARNLAGVPFPHKIRGTKKVKKVIDTAKKTFVQSGSDFSMIEMEDLSPLEKTRLVEQHIISNDLANNQDGVVIVFPDESVSIMIMEEDHYRLQCIRSGFDPMNAYRICQELERMLGKKADYAYDAKLGYLTTCPTNVGTGLRVSVMLHLKALAMSGTLNAAFSSFARFGMTARGLYGEGTPGGADMYQISNQVTLGLREEDIVKNVSTVVQSVIKRERDVRRILYQNNKLQIEDKVMRAYGLLKYAVKMSTREAREYLSMLNMGMALGIIKPCSQTELYNLMMDIMPAMLAKEGNTAAERDRARAERIKKTLA